MSKTYKLESLVKDESVKKALRKALSDDGKLSYEEVQTIIYNTCDGNAITSQEVKDLNSILKHSKTIDTPTKNLINEFIRNPSSFLTFRNFPNSRIPIIANDLIEARRLSALAGTSLILPHSPMSPHIQKIDRLLRDTFSIGLSERDKVRAIQQKFLSFKPRIDKTVFIYSAKSAPPGFMQESAWVIQNEPFRIYVHQTYFHAKPRDRAALLIHEYIHHVNNHQGHPGGIQLAFEQTSMGIPYNQAVNNPYCYDHFIKWL